MPIALKDLTPDVQKYLKGAADQSTDGMVPSEAVLSAIGVTIAKLRDEAKAARREIEDRWRTVEEAYAGIDDANRGEVTGGSQWTKSPSKDGPASRDEVPDTDNRSTLYVRLTQRYVDAGAAKLGEILLAPGAKSFSFSATPVPEVIEAKKDNRPVHLDHLPGAPMAMRALNPGETPPVLPAAAPPAPTMLGSTALTPPSAIGAPPASPVGAAPVPAPAGAVSPAGAAGVPMVPLTAADLAKEKIAKAEESAKKAETRVFNWMVDCRRTAQVRKVIFDSARLGVGVLKGPFPKSSRQMATRRSADGIEVGIRAVIQPASKWVNAWNFFPDPTCGEDVQDGDHCFEREWMGERAVRKLKALPGYIVSQIDKVIVEGPQKVNVSEDGQAPTDETTQLKKGKYETWYFHGTLKREEMGCICEAAGSSEKFNASVPPDQEQVYGIVTMINDSVVRATINPLDSGEFPYHPMPWQRRTGSWAGVGVGEQIDTPQRMLTASVRAMLDNAGISAGGQIVIDTSTITPADGDMGMSPHKIWYMNGDGQALDVNQAFGLFKIDNVTAELMQVVKLAMELAEDSSSIPLISQGQSGETTPDTFGAAKLQDNNANQLLRSIGYSFDDHITEPETQQYYEWLLLDPDVPDDEKGDWTIDARGSSALVERSLQDQFLAQIGPMVLNPAYGVDPKKWFEMLVRSKQLQPKDFQYTPEEQAKIDAAPKPAAPAVQVAQIKAQSDAQALQTETANSDKKLGVESTIALHTIQQTHEEALLEYALKHSISISQVKSELAQTAMKLQTEERLNAQDNAVAVHKNGQQQPGKRSRPQRPAIRPAVQLPGRSPNGTAGGQPA